MVHYEEKEIKLGKEKLEARQRNVQERVALIERYFIPNDFCDIGAGEALFLLELKRRGYKNLIGIEPNKEAAAFATAHDIEVVNGTLLDFSSIAKTHSVKNVSLFHVIEHLHNPREALEILYQSLPDGGRVVIETPNIDAYSFRRSNYRHPLVYEEHLFYFNIDNLLQLLRDIGFKIEAKGIRDFDYRHMSIRKALFLLGIGTSPFTLESDQSNERVSDLQKEKERSLLSRIGRGILRSVLVWLIIILGRLEYQWVIAKK